MAEVQRRKWLSFFQIIYGIRLEIYEDVSMWSSRLHFICRVNASLGSDIMERLG